MTASKVCCSTVFLFLSVSALTAQEQSVEWAELNTRELLGRVATAPQLPLTGELLALQKPRKDWKINEPSSVAAGPNGVFYVLQRGSDADPVIAFDAEGKVLRSWGKGLYTIPHSIRVDPDGNVWTVDCGRSQVHKFSPEGKQLLLIDIGEMPEKRGPFRGASDIAFASDGNLIVADGYGNARILEYTADGRRVREFGSAGNGPGEFRVPHAVAIDERNIIYVGDRENGRIQRFSRDGDYIDQWGGLGKVRALQLDGSTIWAASHRVDRPTASPGWIFRLDRDSGKVMGVVESTGTHTLAITAQGELITRSKPDKILWFRKD